MSDLRQRLIRCFAAAFPNVSEEALPTLTPKSTEDWDSVAMATLLAVMQEEFGIALDILEDLEQLDSFSRVYEYVNSKVAQ